MAADLTIADVYEDASLIGQDIEKIIEHFGHDTMTDLMPKIVRVLEKLEIVVGEKEKDKLEIAELKLENERLYLDIKREASQRRKLDEELYQISSTGETDNLKSMLIKLQEENRRLRMEFEVSANTQPATAYISAPGDAELMHKMKETIDNQRDTIRSKNMEIDSLRNDLQAVEEQIERLTTINESVRKTLGASKARIHTLAKEKAELQTELRALRRIKDDTPVETDESEEEDAEDLEGFMDSYNEPQEQNSEEEEEEGEEVDEETVQNSGENTEEVVAISNGKPPPKPPRVKGEGEENADVLNNNESNVGDDEAKTKADMKENELNVKQNGKDEEEANDDDWQIVGRTRTNAYTREKSEEERKEKRAENQKRGEKENKDPNRPRYTKAEMLEILTERNNLKEKVFALQDELKIYKPGYAEEDEYGHSKISSPGRRASRREESGISRIFSIFTRKGDHH
ncbi:hypothetical protein ACROYT_G010677 [Oculina patagonica]